MSRSIAAIASSTTVPIVGCGAEFTLGRSGVRRDAIALLYLDEPLKPEVVGVLEATGKFTQVRPLVFDVG